MYPNLAEWLGETSRSEAGLVALVLMVGAIVLALAVARYQVALWPRIRELAFLAVILAAAGYIIMEML